MSLVEAPGARARARDVWSPCLGRRNGAHRRIERWAEHLSKVAAIQKEHVTTNQAMDSTGEGALERRFEWAKRVGEDDCPSNQVANGAMKKIKKERAVGPPISMASV